MLYLTTRDHNDAYTIHKTMLSDLAPDGGMFIPFRIPAFTQEDLCEIEKGSVGEVIANVLNRFFCAGINSWTIDAAIGRNCIKTTTLSQKVIAVEPWHNPLQSYEYVENNLYRLLSTSDSVCKQPTVWVRIAIRISLFFAAYCAMVSGDQIGEEEAFDVAVNVADFCDPMAAWYAKQMGLPVNSIICSCVDNDGVWDLIHRGQISLGSVGTKLASGLECLIYNVYGREEAARFVQVFKDKRTFSVDPESEISLNDTFFCAVTGASRATTVVNSIQRTDGYTICASGALAYGAVQDYRAKSGENRLTVLFSDTAK